MRQGQPSASSRGFTLIELMVVLLIAAITLAAGLPALRGLISHQRLVSAANAFFHSASLTRAEAVRRGGSARMVPVDGVDWARGWRIDASTTSDSGGPGPRFTLALPPGITVSYTTGGELIAFRPTGQPVTRGSWTLSSNGRSYVVIINFVGRLRLCDPAADTSCRAAGA